MAASPVFLTVTWVLWQLLYSHILSDPDFGWTTVAPSIIGQLSLGGFLGFCYAYDTAVAIMQSRLGGEWRALFTCPLLLPFTVVLALSAEPWLYQLYIASLRLCCGATALPVARATLPHWQAFGSWWPLDTVYGLLQLAMCAVSRFYGRVGAMFDGCHSWRLRVA